MYMHIRIRTHIRNVVRACWVRHTARRGDACDNVKHEIFIPFVRAYRVALSTGPPQCVYVSRVAARMRYLACASRSGNKFKLPSI